MKKRILIVDDEVNYGLMLKINLEQTGNYEVDAVTSALESYAKVQETRYDLIFLDILMPKIEGHVALGELRKLCKTPVVIMSAYIPHQKLDAILRAGAFGCIEKPVSLERLVRIAEEATGGSKS